MRKSEPARKTKLESPIVADLINVLLKYKLQPQSFGLWLLMADMFQDVCDGEDYYMIVGTTKAKDSYSVTVKGDGAPDPVYANNWSDLNHKCYSLVEGSETS